MKITITILVVLLILAAAGQVLATRAEEEVHLQPGLRAFIVCDNAPGTEIVLAPEGGGVLVACSRPPAQLVQFSFLPLITN